MIFSLLAKSSALSNGILHVSVRAFHVHLISHISYLSSTSYLIHLISHVRLTSHLLSSLIQISPLIHILRLIHISCAKFEPPSDGRDFKKKSETYQTPLRCMGPIFTTCRTFSLLRMPSRRPRVMPATFNSLVPLIIWLSVGHGVSAK